MSNTMKKLKQIDRRTFLQGAGNVMIALPFLDFMIPSSAEAQTAGMPKRFLVVTHGNALGKSNTSDFIPTVTGTNWNPTVALQSINNYPSLKNYLTIVSNLAIKEPVHSRNLNVAGPQITIHIGDDHGLAEGVQLRGTQNGRSGSSCDQLMKANLGLGTNFLHLNYSAQPRPYDGNPNGVMGIQYSGNTSISPVWDPLTAFNSLTSGLTSGNTDQEKLRIKTLQERKSILDLIDKRRVEYLNKLMGANAKAQLTNHFERIRELETQIQTNLNLSSSSGSSGTCSPIATPSSIAIGSDKGSGGTYSSSATTFCWSNETLRSKIFSDLTAMAFACDRARLGTIRLSYTYSMLNANMYGTGFSSSLVDYHEVSHSSGSNSDLARCASWHVNEFLALGERLRNIPEGSGNVLDNTVLIMTSAAGEGPDSHTADKMSLLLLGKAGGAIKTAGQHIAGNKAHPCGVIFAAMKAAGYTGTTFNDVNFEFPGIR